MAKVSMEMPTATPRLPWLPTCASTTVALFPLPSHAKSLSLSLSLSLPKDQILSSLTHLEQTLDQALDAASSFSDSTHHLFQAFKPALDTAFPLVRQAAQDALQLASPAISQAQQALQTSGLDTQPLLSAAQTVADAAQQTGQVLEDAKPFASSTVQTISSADPPVIAASAGAIFLAYLLLPPLWSLLSFNLRGFKGELTPAQTLDLLCSQNYIMVDIRSEKDKNKAGIPRLPSSAKSKMIAMP